MTEKQSNDTLRDVRYAFTSNVRGGSPVKIRCPLPDHEDTNPSFAVYPNGGFCFHCDVYIPAKDFPKYFGVDLDELPERKPQTGRRRKPKGEYESCSPTVQLKVKMYHELLLNQRASRIRWLQNRGITRSTIERFQLGHSGDAFIIPVWYGDQLIGIRYRLDPEYHDEEKLDKYKYINPSGQDTLILRPTPGNVTIITEGELDALVLCQYGFDGVTATSGSGSLHKSLTPKTLKKDWVFVATDLDSPGNDAYAKLCEVWGKHLPRIRWNKRFGKDISELLQNDKRPIKSRIIQELVDLAYERWIEAHWDDYKEV